MRLLLILCFCYMLPLFAGDESCVAGDIDCICEDEHETQSEVGAWLKKRRHSDLSVDRNILMPAAETIPEDMMVYNSYELLLLGISYGLTDRAQLSMTTFLPVDDGSFIGLFSLKYKFFQGDHAIFSIQPGIFLGVSGGDAGIGLVSLSLILDLMLTESITLTLNQSSFGAVQRESDTVGITISAALAFRAGKHVKLIGEIIFPGTFEDGALEVEDEIFLLSYGIRFIGSGVSVDFAMIQPPFESDWKLGFPFLAISGDI